MTEPTPPRALRLAPLLPIGICAAAFLWLVVSGVLAPATLEARLLAAQSWAQTHPLLAALAYVALYVAATLALAPGVLWLAIGAGLLFGGGAGAALTFVGAMCGSTSVFLLARSALGRLWRRRAGGWSRMLKEGLERDGFSYLLALRLLPFAPYFAVNLAPAALNMRLRTFVTATALGMAPGIILYSAIGEGLRAALADARPLSEALVARTEIAAALVALALLAAATAVIRTVRRRRRVA